MAEVFYTNRDFRNRQQNSKLYLKATKNVTSSKNNLQKMQKKTQKHKPYNASRKAMK